MIDLAVARIETRIDKLDLEGAIETTLGESFTNSPALSGLWRPLVKREAIGPGLVALLPECYRTIGRRAQPRLDPLHKDVVLLTVRQFLFARRTENESVNRLTLVMISVTAVDAQPFIHVWFSFLLVKHGKAAKPVGKAELRHCRTRIIRRFLANDDTFVLLVIALGRGFVCVGPACKGHGFVPLRAPRGTAGRDAKKICADARGCVSFLN
jgi:hypothetical protein